MVHHGEEEGEEPAQRDHGEDLQLVLQKMVELGEMLGGELLEYHWGRGGEGRGGEDRGEGRAKEGREGRDQGRRRVGGKGRGEREEGGGGCREGGGGREVGREGIKALSLTVFFLSCDTLEQAMALINEHLENTCSLSAPQ